MLQLRQNETQNQVKQSHREIYNDLAPRVPKKIGIKYTICFGWN